jgi:hypothetical protein
MAINDGSVSSIEFIPLELDKGVGYRDEYDDRESAGLAVAALPV